MAFVRRVLEEGVLLEDEHVGMARSILEQFITDQGMAKDDVVVLNGLPRHVGQARSVDAWVNVDVVVCLDCPVEVVLGRIRNNVGGDRTGREDDQRAAVERRVAMFRERTEPLVGHYAVAGAQIERIEVAVDQTADMMFAHLNDRRSEVL